MKQLVTVSICTWNRARLLAGTLEQMRSLRIPDGFEWELVVVNNNCTDETEDVLRRYSTVLPLRTVFEPSQGVAHARNCAVDAARGGMIIWTDDDVLVDPGWLEAYVGAASRWESAAFFGGPIEVVFEAGIPQWLRESWGTFGSAYGARDFGADEFALDSKTVPFGSSFAVRTDVQRRYRFDVSLGRRKTELLGGEDTVLLRRMLAEGLEGRWVPTARVRHVIPPSRVSEEYLQRFFYCLGRLSARQIEPGRGIRRVSRMPSVIQFKALLAFWRYRIARRLAHPARWSRHLVRESTLRGIAGEMREINRARTPD